MKFRGFEYRLIYLTPVGMAILHSREGLEGDTPGNRHEQCKYNAASQIFTEEVNNKKNYVRMKSQI